MNRVRVLWSGWVGQPGLTTFYLADSALDVTAIRTFFTAMAPFVVAPIVWTIPALGDKINDTDGALVGSWVGTGGGSVSATASNAQYSGVSGFVIDWLTGTIHQNRRIQGRTFLVPSGQNVYQNDGTIIESTRTTIAAAAATLVTSLTPNFLIWSRPYAGRVAQPGPPPLPARPPHDGASGPVVAVRVPDIAAVMRSRRS